MPLLPKKAGPPEYLTTEAQSTRSFQNSVSPTLRALRVSVVHLILLFSLAVPVAAQEAAPTELPQTPPAATPEPTSAPEQEPTAAPVYVVQPGDSVTSTALLPTTDAVWSAIASASKDGIRKSA